MRTPIAALLASAFLCLTAAAAQAQDDRCVGGQTPGGVIIVLFDRGQSILTPRGQRDVSRIASQAIAQKANQLCLEGFADAHRGKERDKDIELARARAEAVASELVANGYPREKIVVRRITDPIRVFGTKETASERKVEIRYGR
ncbi:OmpA family protein [Reyranella sp. CPCC 100927]|uniref:OmpA family protein n=1 Tax=Reyranella sp. CPCC 100927 TaxID=2599616 RepID=UPI0011B5D93B|nr:OmpA family protein [Reyranella sp. CPCC 100927]TWT15774.1 OmpA family protein [Reyranella sp. CPCC 100927]